MDAGYTAILESPPQREDLYRALHATRETAYLKGRRAPLEPAALAPPLRPLRILVAEDNPVNGALLEQMLEAAGHTPRLVTDGEQALAAVLEDTFDLAIVDRHMPLLEGDEVIDRYHRQRPRGELGFILVSADATPATAAAARASGVERLLIKPVTADALLATIAEIAARRAVVDESGRTPAPASLADPVTEAPDNQDSAIARARGHIHSPAFVAQLRRLYVDNVHRTLTLLEEASAAGDLRTLRGVIHELKGGSLAVGEEGIVELCLAIEEALDEQPATVPQDLLEQLRKRLGEITDSP